MMRMMQTTRISILSLVLLSLTILPAYIYGQTSSPRSFPIAEGWAKNQINAVIFRRNSLVSHGDTQYVAFYDAAARIVLGKRKLGTSAWQVFKTPYVGDASDAHKSISIAVDGAGYLHMVWNQHDSPLQYCRALRPGSLELSDQLPMLNDKESRVTYPEFYNLPGGDLLFVYRDGSSGRGNLVLARYHVGLSKWSRVQDKLIDGENTRSSYWQVAIEQNGTIHLSWVWRETPDVATNHDVCYAKSLDGGRTWRKSSGERYQLPITAASAEYVLRIPQRSDLINQTSMTTDARGRPYIVSYWRPQGTEIPQYHLIYHDGRVWKTSQITHRVTPFELGGVGTKRIPISRPLVLVDPAAGKSKVLVIFRDAERGDAISVAVNGRRDDSWTISDLNKTSVGMWEPTYDPVVWQQRKEIHLFVQNVGQGDAESVQEIPPQMITVLEWKPTYPAGL